MTDTPTCCWFDGDRCMTHGTEAQRDRWRQRAEQAEQRVQALIDEVLTICDSFTVAPEGSPEYIYSLGRRDGLAWTRAAVERAMGKGERNSTPYVPLERAEQAEAANARVRALHVRNAHTGNCEHCSERDYPDYAVPWPCPTMDGEGR